nr:hypothetical protein [uncultured Peptostreptococcus sp.]
MGFTLAVLSFYLVFLLLLLFTLYIYIKLVIAVKAGKEVPEWIYKLGQTLKPRRYIKNDDDDITDPRSLKEANLFILSLVFVNLLAFTLLYYKKGRLDMALYTLLNYQFGMVVINLFISRIIKLIYVFSMYKSNKPIYSYSPTSAVIGCVFFSSFVLTLCISLTGLPAKPVTVELDNTKLVVGQTRATNLLASGFIFKDKGPDSEIVNQRNDHFYYGQRAELIRDKKSYGYVYITPKWSDSDKLKNCIITYYRIEANNDQVSKIKFNNTNLSRLTIKDFQTRKLTDVFSLSPIDYEEVKTDTSYILTIQTYGYSLWKSYRINVNYNSNNTLNFFSVGAQHTIWE